MDIKEKMQGIEDAILSLPENEVTHFLITITNKVQKRRLNRGSELKKELDVIGHEHDKLHAFINSDLVEA